MEKPTKEQTNSNLINGGFYIFNQKICDYIKKGFCMLEKDVFPLLSKERKIAGYKHKGQWFDTGTFERWETAINNWKNPGEINKKEYNIFTINKPWGKFRQFCLNEKATVKIITVEPHKRLSLQSHENRNELWIALDNPFKIILNNEEKILRKDDFIYIPKNTKHRIIALDKKARILEISFGYFDENDITRYEDDFNRL